MWLTTKDGRHFNTDWMDDDEKKKYADIIRNEQEAAKRTNQISPYNIWSSNHLSSRNNIESQFKSGNISKEKYNEVISKMDANANLIADMMDKNKTISSGDLYKTANGFVLKDSAHSIFMDDSGVVRKMPEGEMKTAHGQYGISRNDEKERQIAENKKQADSRNETVEKPVFGGDYKATPEMVKIVDETARQMQEEFPILNKQFNIDINKNMESAGLNSDDKGIELRGATLKRCLEYGKEKVIRGTVAHELTHLIQERLIRQNGLSKYIFDEESKNYIDSIWDRAVERYVKDNPKFTVKEVNKIMSNAYGDGGHSRIGGTSIEKMAVAVQQVYRGYGKVELGKYVIEELKKEMK